MTGPAKNVLSRAGVFHRNILEAMEAIRTFMEKTADTSPSHDVIAKSLKSSFILSEIKNQIIWQRKNARKANVSKKSP